MVKLSPNRPHCNLMVGLSLVCLGIIMSFYHPNVHMFGAKFFTYFPDSFFSGLLVTFVGLLFVCMKPFGNPYKIFILDILAFGILSLMLWSLSSYYPNLPMGVATALPVWMCSGYLLVNSMAVSYQCYFRHCPWEEVCHKKNVPSCEAQQDTNHALG